MEEIFEDFDEQESLNGTHFSGIKQCKCMVGLRDFPFKIVPCLGWCLIMTPDEAQFFPQIWGPFVTARYEGPILPNFVPVVCSTKPTEDLPSRGDGDTPPKFNSSPPEK